MTEVYDCYAVLHMHIPSTADACAAARATIRAAEIQGKAARSAGGQSIVSGLMALTAGGLAFAAALSETFRLRRIEAGKRRSYSLYLAATLAGASKELATFKAYFEEMASLPTDDAARRGINLNTDFTATNIVNAREALTLANWQEVGNLPENAIDIAVLFTIGVNSLLNSFTHVRDLCGKEDSYIGSLSQENVSLLLDGRKIINKASRGALVTIGPMTRAIERLIEEINEAHPPKPNAFDGLSATAADEEFSGGPEAPRSDA